MMVVRAMQHGLDLLTVKPTMNPLERFDRSIDFAAMTPQQVYTSLIQGQNLNCIKKLIIGGGEVTQALKDLLQPLNVECFATYGMTETLTHIALQRLNGCDAQSAYECLPDVEVWTDDRSCLVIKTPYLTETIVTNDIVEIIGKNRFRWVGRSDNVINSGGIKIFPEQVEKMIQPLVKGSFFLASRPDVSLGERLILILEGEEPDSENKRMMMDGMKSNLAPYHCPKEIVFLPKFVYTETGKINRRKTLEIIFFKHFMV
jgi:O-succinylbenzoic acid--CoA ligase